MKEIKEHFKIFILFTLLYPIVGVIHWYSLCGNYPCNYGVLTHSGIFLLSGLFLNTLIFTLFKP